MPARAALRSPSRLTVLGTMPAGRGVAPLGAGWTGGMLTAGGAVVGTRGAAVVPAGAG
jgi:hypothetical protein